MRPLALVFCGVLIALAFPPSASLAGPSSVHLGLVQVSSGFSDPVAMAFPPTGGRIAIAEQAGIVRMRLSNGTLSTYLDIRGRVNQGGGERGLLGIAFPSSFGSTGNFFVYYTTPSGSERVSRFHAASASATSVSASTEVIVLTMSHPTYANHNGGQLQFGPDGYLYIGTGDGGGSGDPGGNAQNLRSLLGKILRIDVNRSCGVVHYCVPATNPYYRSTTAKREIWDLGLRNPWRFSFDRESKHLFIADVGQSAREEVDVTPNRSGGINWGWDCYEGTVNTVSSYGGSYCSGRHFSPPVYQYAHSGGRCAIIGGYRYRGSLYPAMTGMYSFADYCTGEIFLLQSTSSGWVASMRLDHTASIPTFGESRAGEIFVADANGALYRLTA